MEAHRGPLSQEQVLRRVRMGHGRPREIRPGLEHVGNLHVVAPDDWNHSDPEKQDRIRKQILYQMWGNTTGYPPEFYAAKDTYRTDAGLCFKQHGAPGGSDSGPANCLDFESDKKRLTDQAWRKRNPDRKHIYLCDFCAYKSVVTTRMRMKRGDYDR